MFLRFQQRSLRQFTGCILWLEASSYCVGDLPGIGTRGSITVPHGEGYEMWNPSCHVQKTLHGIRNTREGAGGLDGEFASVLRQYRPGCSPWPTAEDEHAVLAGHVNGLTTCC